MTFNFGLRSDIYSTCASYICRKLSVLFTTFCNTAYTCLTGNRKSAHTGQKKQNSYSNDNVTVTLDKLQFGVQKDNK